MNYPIVKCTGEVYCGCNDCYDDRLAWKRLTPQQQAEVVSKMFGASRRTYADWRCKMIAAGAYKALREYKQEVK